MFGKMFAYELKESSKKIFVIYIVAVIACINFGIYIRFAENVKNMYIPIYSIISVLLLIVSMVTLNIGTIVYNAQRYKATMFSEQGYLTHTLPVKTSFIFLAKYLVTIIWTIFSAIMSFICGCLIIAVISADGIKEFFDGFFNNFDVINMECKYLFNCGIIGILILSFLMALAGAMLFFMTLYLSMAIGNLANKHKKLLGVVSFFGIYTVIQNIGEILSKIFKINDLIERKISVSSFNFRYLGPTSYDYASVNIQSLSICVIVFCLVFTTILYFVNRYILKHSLNI